MNKKKLGMVLALLMLAALLFGAAASVLVEKTAYIYREFRMRIEDIDSRTQKIEYKTRMNAGAYEFDYSWLKDNGLVAHALGGIDGKDYTNSLEAMEQAYENGFRVFEGDIQLLDGEAVLMHSGEDFCEMSSLAYDELDADSFYKAKIYGSYTPLDVSAVVKFLSEHPDAWFMTDTKYEDNPYTSAVLSQLAVEALELDEAVLDRVIVQIYNQKMLDDVMSVYPFRSVVYTLYMSSDSEQEVINFCLSTGIGAVTAHISRIEEQFVSKLDTVGISVLTHTSNDPDEVNAFLETGVSAVYTDFVLPEQLKSPLAQK